MKVVIVLLLVCLVVASGHFTRFARKGPNSNSRVPSVDADLEASSPPLIADRSEIVDKYATPVFRRRRDILTDSEKFLHFRDDDTYF